MKRAIISVLQVIGYFILFLTVTIAVMGTTKRFGGDWEAGGFMLDLAGESVLTILGIALTNLLIFLAARSSGVFRGWPALRSSLSGFAGGSIAGLTMAFSMLLVTLVLGGAELIIDGEAAHAYLPYVIPLGGCLLVASLAEEWLFRGYPLTKLSEAFGRGWANLLMALLFAAAHWGSTGFNSMTMLNIVLGSLVVGAIRFTAGGIPAAWGFHFAWNFTQVLCGANLSLEEIQVPGVTLVSNGPDIVSGGAFGPEAGIGATVATVLVLGTLVVYFRRRGAADLPLPLGRRNEGIGTTG